MEKTQQGEEKITKEKQEEQSVQHTQLPPPSPPHTTLVETITIKDVPDTTSQNVNPLTIEDLKKILHQTSLQAQLCENSVLVSVEEL